MSTGFQQAAGNAAIGIITVMGILIFLSIVIWLFGRINVLIGDGTAPKKADERKTGPAEAPGTVITDAITEEEEIAAVIAAAIAAATEEDALQGKAGNYCVSSVRRVRKRFA